MRSYKKRLIKYLLALALLFIPLTTIAQPSHDGEFSVYYKATHPLYIEPVVRTNDDTLPYSIRSNCYAYVKHVYPQLPNTDTILSNLSANGEVAVFYYPKSNLYHYAVVESIEPLVVTDTNYGSKTKKTRNETSLNLVGFYKLP